ncbi:hypothetical protein Bbelb_302400 [Branchiostoma belcheri]|nr:hypothetical protein Bbelb_302400 [Branchiostoma belcheri]
MPPVVTTKPPTKLSNELNLGPDNNIRVWCEISKSTAGPVTDGGGVPNVYFYVLSGDLGRATLTSVNFAKILATLTTEAENRYNRQAGRSPWGGASSLFEFEILPPSQWAGPRLCAVIGRRTASSFAGLKSSGSFLRRKEPEDFSPAKEDAI